MKIPDFPDRSLERKRIYICEVLPAPLTRADEHWQIFDDYTAWPELRLRQIRVPQSREWFRASEKIKILSTEKGLAEEITRTVLSEDEFAAHGDHGEKEIRKNRYFFVHQGREMAADVFLGSLWGLILAQISFTGEDESEQFTIPEFAVLEVSGSEFFRGENLVEKDFEAVRKEFARLKVMGNE